ncbi:cupin domain-containing protein [Agarilytica rhodophyticola]|uniref:cupin domain-containing protein n=1 Tax=Agarilytica rhodophyticola TaxID=1737490 RepID=UPI000B349218|nr:cupin domain-containing protein [Agarilytica rhodophyticola]
MSPTHTPCFAPLTHLGDLPIEIFLKDYWQKKPLLVRQAFANFQSIVSADELAGFAIDDDVVSRLVVENTSDSSWSLQHGPIPEEVFSELPDNNWSLLIQHADSLDPHINALLNAFRFIPNWRLDDIMVSYAPDGGGVGPHFDFFDVFLLQGEGKRRWRVGQKCDHTSPLMPNNPMKILQEFYTEEEWIVEPGDLLYIPAQVAHWGEAIEESITYSIGFRAPSYGDILLDYSQEVASHYEQSQRYQDADLTKQENPGEITHQTLEKFKNILLEASNNKDYLSQWLGEYTTQLKQNIDGMFEPIPETQIVDNKPYQLSRYCRAAFHTQADKTLCFINGNTVQCSRALAVALTEYRAIHYDQYGAHDQQVILQLAHHQLMEAYEG